MLHLKHEFRIGEFLPPGTGMDIIGPEDILVNTFGRRAIGKCDNAEVLIAIRP
jgi:hypothetical protein